MTLVRHLLSILLLPVTVTVVIPVLLLEPDAADATSLTQIAGALTLASGLTLLGSTIWHFATRGRGTLAPWDPPRQLVVSGVYKYVRNPMISGVVLVLVGESLVLRSAAIAAWPAIFIGMNAIYIPTVEEKRLAIRFGRQYEEYREHVPRWIPRLAPWHGNPPFPPN